MSYLDDQRLLVKVANLYYQENETQSAIAKKIGVSRPLISKFLAKAREKGIVEIIIHDDLHTASAIENKLEKKYSLREVICLPDTVTHNVKKQLGAAASNYLLRVLKDGQIVGISSGTTIYEVANAMPSNQKFPDICFVPLVGGMGNERLDIHANILVANFAEALGANYQLLHAPVIVDSKEAKNIISKQTSIKKIMDLASRVDIAIVGIGGTPEHSTMVKSYYDSGILDDLNYDDIVGDICYNFINDEGKPINNSWNEKVISLDLNKLKNIPLVVGIAAGREKAKAIKASLTNSLIDVLITDEETAKLLL